MAAITICSDFGAPQNKVWHCFHCFSIYFPWSDGTECHDLSFLNVELKSKFFTLLFDFHQRLFTPSSLSAIMVVSSAYLRLLIFLPAILIPATGTYSSSISNFVRSFHTVFESACLKHIPIISVQELPRFHILINPSYFLSFWGQPFQEVWGDVSL